MKPSCRNDSYQFISESKYYCQLSGVIRETQNAISILLARVFVIVIDHIWRISKDLLSLGGGDVVLVQAIADIGIIPLKTLNLS